MHPLAESSVQQLKSQGLRLELLRDFDDLCKLNDLASGVTDSEPAREWVRKMTPAVPLGNVCLYRLTLGAEDFVQWAIEWYRDDVSVAFVMSLSNSPEKLWRINSKAAFLRALLIWKAKANFTRREMNEAMLSMQQAEKSIENEQKRVDKSGNYGWLVEGLCAEHGMGPEYWIWKAPMEMVQMMATAYVARKEREARAAGGKTNPDSEYAARLYRFRTFEETFRKKLMEAV